MSHWSCVLSHRLWPNNFSVGHALFSVERTSNMEIQEIIGSHWNVSHLMKSANIHQPTCELPSGTCGASGAARSGSW